MGVPVFLCVWFVANYSFDRQLSQITMVESMMVSSWLEFLRVWSVANHSLNK